MKLTFPQVVSAIAIVGAVVLFALGRDEAAAIVLAFSAGQFVPSPVRRKLNQSPHAEANGVADE